MPRRTPICLISLLSVQIVASAASEPAVTPTKILSPIEQEFSTTASPNFQQFCFNCHGDKKTKARLNLQRLSAQPDFLGSFKTWEKIGEMLQTREMPPEDEPQPSDAERKAMISAIRDNLAAFIRAEAGDPGRVVMRQLTSAEYAYTILDLTGLDLGLERNFVNDAVGGEGFSNVGEVQFIQDSTLERYLEAAKLVASHAVIGAAPLRFYRSPGKTGQELSAIARIQDIYKRHGFRTISGEGGKAFGLECYPKAYYAAWRFDHRRELGLDGTSLAAIAKEEGIEPRFLEYIDRLVNDPSLSFPGNEIAAAFKSLPVPERRAATEAQKLRAECENLFRLQRLWQTTFAQNSGDPEGPGEESFQPSLTNSFRIRLSWPAGTSNGTFTLAISSVGKESAKPVVTWKQPALRFRQRGAVMANNRIRQPGKPLKDFVTEETAKKLAFGQSFTETSIGTNDFMTEGSAVLTVEFQIPPGMTQAELLMDAKLTASNQEDCVARCVLSHELSDGETAAATGTFSILLANPAGHNIETLKAGVAEFAAKFPLNSHREAAPADRDPIPAPFDNSYNNPERNDFHYVIKYDRDDHFLTEHILDDATRTELDQAWSDLLGSFEYQQTFLKFVAKKYKLDLGDQTIATLTPEWINGLPEEPRAFVKQLHDGYVAMRRAHESAEPGHLDDLLHFAQLAWRRPLTASEENRLRAFYATLRIDSKLDHTESLRAVLARILVSPAFLYRVEKPSATPEDTTAKRVQLSNFELASRLSYFLWSSIPDAELSRAASNGELKNPETLAHHAQRMLRDPKARRFATEFFGQWFGFYRFDAWRGVDTTRFPEFTDSLKTAMYDEAVSLFDYVVRENRPVREILFADYSFLNRDLARHYGLDSISVSTNDLTRVEHVDQFHRGGLLRLGAVLTATSAPLRTSAVKRGDWMLRRVLGRSVPPPPGDAGSIPPDDVLDDGKTVRQRLEAHRRDASCVNCHSRIDPLGFALEHFDSVGRWRDTYRDGQKIDASGTLNDGAEISEFEGLIKYLQAHEASFNRTLCGKLLGYALGRAEMVTDKPLIEKMTRGLAVDDRFAPLITEIVTSPQFRYRRAQDATPDPKRLASH